MKQERKVAVVSGVGVSTGSGVPDFRTVGEGWGLFVPCEEALDVNFMGSADRVMFWECFNFIFNVEEVSVKAPSVAYGFVKWLESFADVAVYTLNVDGLHQKAGSENVVEFHGNVRWFSCLDCEGKVPAFCSDLRVGG